MDDNIKYMCGYPEQYSLNWIRNVYIVYEFSELEPKKFSFCTLNHSVAKSGARLLTKCMETSCDSYYRTYVFAGMTPKNFPISFSVFPLYINSNVINLVAEDKKNLAETYQVNSRKSEYRHISIHQAIEQ